MEKIVLFEVTEPNTTAEYPPFDGKISSATVSDSPSEDRIRVYHATAQRGWGLRIWLQMAHQIAQNRELIWRLFIRDFTARYRQSILGILWAVILPLITVGTFLVLNRSGVLNIGATNVPYPVYALLGLTIWQVFAGGLTACSNSIVAGGGMVVKINFPKITLVLAAMGQVLFEFFVRLILLVAGMALFDAWPEWTVILLPLTVLPLLLLTLGLGFMLALVNVVLRDVANIVTFTTTSLMFLTPVIYPAPRSGTLAQLMEWNPVSGLVTASRDVVFNGHLTNPMAFAWNSALGIFSFLVAWRIFHLVECRIAERV